MTKLIEFLFKKRVDTTREAPTCNYANNYYGDQMCTASNTSTHII